MHILFSSLYDALFPPSTDALIVRTLTVAEVELLYVPREIHSFYTLTSYRDMRVRALIHEAKFHQNTHAISLLHGLVRIWLSRYSKKIDCIIPIPLSSHRLRTRGYNQIEEILRGGDTPLSIPIDTTTLKRVRDTRAQTELPRDARLVNLHGAFEVPHPERVQGKHILLIDDVMTTGATLHTAEEALLPASPASITCVALAH